MRKTYGLLGVSLVGFALLTAGMMRFATEASLRFSSWAFTGQLNWLIVIGLFMLVGYVAQRLAMSQTSRGLQLFGLGIFVAAESALLQPLLWVLIFRFGDRHMLRSGVLLSGYAGPLLLQAVVITLAIFIGLTLTVFITKKDFSFMGGMLTVASFAVLGVILASMLFGFSLGAFFCGAVILIMAGYILYQTSLVMSYFPPTGYVAAALMLFSTIATLFWYVLQLLMSLNNRR
ncbi:MAG TPA: Bax inhibitor-1 family protein [Kofleriaceae bacterium]|nr:Bax inhibitor-1 family protein [Kofleriaceae bacterium]